MFVEEPAKANPLFGTPGLVATPHLGASTTEAQVNVAIQVAEQMSDFLIRGGVTNALNMPSLSAEEAPRLRPYMALAEKLGSWSASSRAWRAHRRSRSRSRAPPPQLNQKPITGAVLAGLMRVYSDSVNMVNAPFLARERGLDVREVRHDREGDYHTLVRVTVDDRGRRALGRRHPVRQRRAAPRRHVRDPASRPSSTATMIYIVNEDTPGFIGRLGTLLGEAGVNIATFNLGRRDAGGEAVALVSVDSVIGPELVAKLEALGGVKRVKPLRFEPPPKGGAGVGARVGAPDDSAAAKRRHRAAAPRTHP